VLRDGRSCSCSAPLGLLAQIERVPRRRPRPWPAEAALDLAFAALLYYCLGRVAAAHERAAEDDAAHGEAR